MGVDHKKGDIVKTKINGEVVNCVVLSDYMTQLEIEPDDYYLDYLGGSVTKDDGYKICLWSWEKCIFFSGGFYALIGDQKVHVEFDEIW